MRSGKFQFEIIPASLLHPHWEKRLPGDEN
jgi:hypothetical protein